MNNLPIMLNLKGKKVLIVGGGTVGKRRFQSIERTGAKITLIDPHLDPEMIKAFPDHKFIERYYVTQDMVDQFMVIISTNIKEVNDKIAADAKHHGVLMNRADAPEEGDITIPAHRHEGNITISVATSGISARTGAKLRDELFDKLEPHWHDLLQTIEPWREKIQEAFPDDDSTRQELLKDLGSEDAIEIIKSDGREAMWAYIKQKFDAAKKK